MNKKQVLFEYNQQIATRETEDFALLDQDFPLNKPKTKILELGILTSDTFSTHWPYAIAVIN